LSIYTQSFQYRKVQNFVHFMFVNFVASFHCCSFSFDVLAVVEFMFLLLQLLLFFAILQTRPNCFSTVVSRRFCCCRTFPPLFFCVFSLSNTFCRSRSLPSKTKLHQFFPGGFINHSINQSIEKNRYTINQVLKKLGNLSTNTWSQVRPLSICFTFPRMKEEGRRRHGGQLILYVGLYSYIQQSHCTAFPGNTWLPAAD